MLILEISDKLCLKFDDYSINIHESDLIVK